MSTFRLGLCLPSLDTWDADFAVCIVNLALTMQKVRVPTYDGNGLWIYNRRGSILPQSRQDLVIDAMKKNCTHALFIDSDQFVPADLPHRLAKHGELVVGCNIATKAQTKSMPTARSKPKPGEWWGGHPIYSNHRHGLEQVWRLGFGVMLLNLKIFDNLPKPWFLQRWLPDHNEFVGEDWHFCELMEQHNIPIMVDHDTSMMVGHMGRWMYTHEGCVDIPEPDKEAA